MKEILLKIYRRMLPLKLRVKLKAFFWSILNKLHMGGKAPTGIFVSLGGKNRGKKIVVFRFNTSSYGILAVWRNAVGCIKWAEDRGYIPYIDYENPSAYLQNEIGNDNIYEYCFPQYSVLKAEEILSSRQVMFSPNEIIEIPKVLNKYDAKYYADFKKNHIIGKAWFSKEKIKWLEDSANEILPSNVNILGVSVRENFRLLSEVGASIAERHPHEPPIEVILKKAKELVLQWDCKFIFLSTLFLDTIKIFEEAFPDCVIYIERKRLKMDDEYRNYYAKVNRKSPNDEVGIEKMISDSKYSGKKDERRDTYVEEVYLLSKCTHFIATKNGGSSAAMYWNGGKYKDVYFFEDLNKSSAY